MAAGDVELLVTDVQPRLRNALIRLARKQDLSVNEVAGRILAERYDVQRPAGTTRFVPLTRATGLMLRVPEEVRQRIRIQAAANGATISGLVKVALAEAVGLPAPDPHRKPRRKK